MSHASNPSRSPNLLILALCLLLPAGCCKPCIHPLLPIEPQPALHRVDLYRPDSPLAEYCLTDRGRRDVLINLELYRSALEVSRETIRLYNETVKPPEGSDPLKATTK